MELCFDIAHLAHVEMYSNKFEESLQFFLQVDGLSLTGRDENSAYLRAWDDYEFHTLKLTRHHTTGVGHLDSSPGALQRRVEAIAKSGYRVIGGVDGDQRRGRAYRFEDPFGHVFEIYCDTVRYRPPGKEKPVLKNVAQCYHGLGCHLPLLDHLNLLASHMSEFRRFVQTCLGSRVTEMIQLDNGRIGDCWFTVNNKGNDLPAPRSVAGRCAPPPRHLCHRFARRHPARRRHLFGERHPHRDRAAQACHPGNILSLSLGTGRQPVVWTETERRKGQAWGLKTIDTFHTHGTPPVAKTGD